MYSLKFQLIGYDIFIDCNSLKFILISYLIDNLKGLLFDTRLMLLILSYY